MRGRRGAILVLIGSALLLLPSLGRMAAHETTDARYLEIAREMSASGDWLTPRLAGVVHLDKPPLAYWSAALGFELFGVSPFAGRLGEQICLGATALLLYLYARRRLGEGPALIAAGVLLTSTLVFVSSRALHTDLFQLLFVSAALLAFYEGSAGTGRTLPTALGFAALGLSMWAKGPIAVMVAAVVVVPFLWLRRSERRLPLRGVALGLVLFALIGLPWYVGWLQRDPSFARWLIERQVGARIHGGGEGHLHGPAYLPMHVLVGLAPWTPLVVLSLWRLRPRRGQRGEAFDLFATLWLVVPCLLFELFATKLPTYVLPAFPAAALLVARACQRGLLADRSARIAAALSALLTGIAALAAAGLLGVERSTAAHAPRWLERDALEVPLLFAAGLCVCAAAAFMLAREALRRAPSWSIPRCVLATAAALGLGACALAPGISNHAGDAQLVRSVPDARVIGYGVFEPGMLFYTGDPTRFYVAIHERLTRQAKQRGEGAHLALRRQDVKAMVGEDIPTFVLARRHHEETLVHELGLRPVRRSQRFVLLANAAAGDDALPIARER